MIGHYSFELWTPTNGWDYVNTLLLMAGGVTLALLLPRRLITAFRRGASLSSRVDRNRAWAMVDA